LLPAGAEELFDGGVALAVEPPAWAVFGHEVDVQAATRRTG
jgi:hypothetical protein